MGKFCTGPLLVWMENDLNQNETLYNMKNKRCTASIDDTCEHWVDDYRGITLCVIAKLFMVPVNLNYDLTYRVPNL